MLHPKGQDSYEPGSKLPVSPLISPTLLPYIIHYITFSQEFRLQLTCASVNISSATRVEGRNSLDSLKLRVTFSALLFREAALQLAPKTSSPALDCHIPRRVFKQHDSSKVSLRSSELPAFLNSCHDRKNA